MKTRTEIEQILIEKALKDEEFKKLLIENPSMAIEKELGYKIPESIKISVLQEDPGTVYLVLPKNVQTTDDMELTEHELQGVAGGTGGQWSWDYCE